MNHDAMCSNTLQRGSATVEFVLVAIALIPIFLLTPTLTKTGDAKLASAQAARYGAWEQTIQHKNGDRLAVEINNRFYAKPDMAIRTEQEVVTGEDQQNDFWGGGGLNERLVNTADADTLSVTVKRSSPGGSAAAVENVVAKLGKRIGAAVPNSKWDIGSGGIYTVNVGLKVKNATRIIRSEQGQNCQGGAAENAHCMRQRSAILVDTWGARGPAEVEQRVRSLVPAGALQPLGDTVAVIGKALPIFRELKKLKGAIGQVRPDILPPDRYGEE